MYRIDPARLDLVEEFKRNPGGPHSPELTLLVNRLRLGERAERYVLICTKRGREWRISKLPTVRGARFEFVDGRVFDDYMAAVWEIFRLRWEFVTGVKLA